MSLARIAGLRLQSRPKDDAVGRGVAGGDALGIELAALGPRGSPSKGARYAEREGGADGARGLEELAAGTHAADRASSCGTAATFQRAFRRELLLARSAVKGEALCFCTETLSPSRNLTMSDTSRCLISMSAAAAVLMVLAGCQRAAEEKKVAAAGGLGAGREQAAAADPLCRHGPGSIAERLQGPVGLRQRQVAGCQRDSRG